MNHQIQILKATGERESFDIARLEASLARSGATDDIAREIAEQVASDLRPLTPTTLIYQKAFRLLADKARRPAARYSLRKAIHALGPTGFPFEELIAEMYRNKGYNAKRGIFITGKCAPHEIDVLAIKDGVAEAVEAKFHNQSGIKSDLKVALYVKARFEDIMGTVVSFDGEKVSARISDTYLITNTKFSSTAINYAECAGLKLIGWNYPEHHNLHDLIEEYNVHPVTSLRKLSDANKRQLLQQGIIFIRQIQENPKILSTLGFGDIMSQSILEEIKSIL